LHPLLHAFLQVCLLRSGPQDLPSSGFLLLAALVLHALSGVGLALAYQSVAAALGVGITDTVLLAVMTGSLLYLQRHPERVGQTLTALAGTGFLLGVLALVPTWWWTLARAAGGDVSVPALLLLGLIVWSILVMGHILRHALSAPLPVGLVAAVAFYWVAVSLQDAIFPIGE
jgi:hypothetical protein